jgi:hypothetical protein
MDAGVSKVLKKCNASASACQLTRWVLKKWSFNEE